MSLRVPVFPSVELLRRAVRTVAASFFVALSAVDANFAAESANTATNTATNDSPTIVEPRMVHLRNDAIREWSSFPAAPEGDRLERRFEGRKNAREYALRVRQQDVKQTWRVQLNGKRLGELASDEADIVQYLPVPPGAIRDGENLLTIETTARGAPKADDIRVGELRIESRPVEELLAETTLELTVEDADSRRPLPARLTIVDAAGSLHATSGVSNARQAVRPGVVYVADGATRVGLPAGRYTIYAGRGFEYSLDRVEVVLTAGRTERRTLVIRRETPTEGYVACDPHVHTVTFSKHGDATIDERMITLAGEGIELPIATDHNVHVDYQAHAERLGVRRHFTPVVGGEVTTKVGHFNVFPTHSQARVPDFAKTQWASLFEEIFAAPGVRVAILNHARDVHSGVRPFGPELFNAAIGENREGWPMRFNGMEIVNSGATQTDPLQLTRDWMAVLNRGYSVTPVGSSDSHDVSRYIVGQGRTYVRCDDRDVGRLDVDAAVDNFLAGRVLVSHGLIAELTVDEKHRAGDLAARVGDEMRLDARVLAPHWIQVDHVQLFANGRLLREEKPAAREAELPRGVAWRTTWRMPRPRHDVHLTLVATGPGVEGPYWATAKPYQPTSPDWTSRVLGVSGAVWVDGDGDGRRSSARDYADRIGGPLAGDLPKLLAALGPFDASVAAQAAELYRRAGGDFESEAYRAALAAAAPDAAAGFQEYRKARLPQ